MALCSLKDLVLRFGDENLFDGISLHIEDGDRIVLLGRNGVGKSTLFRVISGKIAPDSGQLAVGKGLRVGMLEQDFLGRFSGTALDFCLSESEALAGRALPVEDREIAAQVYLSKLGVALDSSFEQLSGGGRRRTMLAATLASDPDLLLLDEPTNHLDIESILWLEDFLLRRAKSLVLITHDRAFARRIGTRIAELDRGSLYAFDCGYEEFLRRKAAVEAAQDRADAQFDKRLAGEEAWLRRGVKARRTRDEGRVKSLLRMREEHRQRRKKMGSARLVAAEAERSGDLVAELEKVSFQWDSEDAEPLVTELSTTILRGDKLGIVGPNGTGKTTLVRLLMGELQPTSGVLRRGIGLQAVYFDQLRSELDLNKSVVENLSGGDDSVFVGGRQRHVNAYLQDFLFSPDRARSPVAILSGGERNRLLLAKLFATPSNLLVLDEPTNDLDLETLELLEDLILAYSGTVILVSHDREFLDNVVTECLVFAGSGRVEEHVGGYADWRNALEAQRSAASSAPDERSGQSKARLANRGETQGPRKLSYKEKQELDALPDRIGTLEARIAEIHEALADPQLYKENPSAAKTLSGELSAAEENLTVAYHRWQELEDGAL